MADVKTSTGAWKDSDDSLSKAKQKVISVKRTLMGTVGVVLAGALVAACSSSSANGTTGSGACTEPKPQCSSCTGSPPIVPSCEQGRWVCPAAGPCASPAPDASTSDGPPSPLCCYYHDPSPPYCTCYQDASDCGSGGEVVASCACGTYQTEFTLACSDTGSGDAADGGDAASEGGTADPLLGAWSYSGSVPDQVTIVLSFNEGGTCSLVEQVAPSGTPTGDASGQCVTTDTYFGTYTEADADATKVLTMTFTGGTANALSGCNPDSGDTAGVPMTADSIASYRTQGLIPATTVTYTVTSTALVISPGIGLGPPGSTTLTRSP